MVDLAVGIEAKNYGLKRTPDPKILQESLLLILPLAIIAGALSFHIWTRSETIHVGYQTQEFKLQEEELVRSREQLIVEEQTLKDPQWLDAVADKYLGMVVVRPDQIIPAPIRNWDASNSKNTLIVNLIQPDATKKASTN